MTPKAAPFPSREQIVAFIRESPGEVGKREIARAFRLDGDQRVALKRILKELEADGTLASGAAAFIAIWRRLPAFTWLATLGSFRPVLAVLDAGYGLFLRVRPWWRPAHAGAPSAPAPRP